MQAIQLATASEPLSLQQEYDMQQSWRLDNDKLTFIICHSIENSSKDEISREMDSPKFMLGDVNLFLSIWEEDGLSVVGEIEIMVADKKSRGKGLGKATLAAFLKYIADHEGAILNEFWNGRESSANSLTFLRARIGVTNTHSIKLFESMGFKKLTEEANVFGEIELRTSSDLGALSGQLLADDRLKRYREMEYVSR